MLTDTKVERIDLHAHELELSTGDTLGYDRLALAIGSQPLMPPIPGIDLDGVYAYRGPSDTAAIRAAAAKASHAAVIGGGLLGLEAARGVQAQGCPVTVVHLMDRLMERQLDDASASSGLASVAEVAEATKATTGCGSGTGEVEQRIANGSSGGNTHDKELKLEAAKVEA